MTKKCKICAAQFPHKKALAANFADRDDFHLISISADPSDTPAKLQQYAQSHGATWTYVSDQYGLYQKFNVNARPYIVFVDRDGNIQKTITRITPAEDLIDIVQDILDKPATPETNEVNVTAQALAPLVVAPAGLTMTARGPCRAPHTAVPASLRARTPPRQTSSR